MSAAAPRGLPICRYDPQSLAAEFAPDFTLVDSRLEAHRTPAGKVQNFQFSLLKRR
jgi:hypothetical protein